MPGLLAAKKAGAKSVDVAFGMDGTARMRVILADVGNDNTPAAPTEEIVAVTEEPMPRPRPKHLHTRHGKVVWFVRVGKAVQGAMHQVGAETVISLGADPSITLLGVSASGLHASDFLLMLDRAPQARCWVHKTANMHRMEVETAFEDRARADQVAAKRGPPVRHDTQWRMTDERSCLQHVVVLGGLQPAAS